MQLESFVFLNYIRSDCHHPKLGPSASGIIFVVLIPFRFMISEQTDSPDKVSIVNKSPTTLTSTGGLVKIHLTEAQFDFLRFH